MNNNGEEIKNIADTVDSATKNIESIKDIDINTAQTFIQKYTEKIIDYLPIIIVSVVVFFLGLFVIKYIEKAINAFFKKTNFDEALENFIESFLVITMKLVLFVIVIGMLGVKTSSFIAIFGAMVFAIGMALQGSLSNFAGGVLLLFFKPFKIGDVIESNDKMGTVKNIQIFNTILETPDGKKVILPNGSVSNNVITNHTDIKDRRLDLIIGIDYSDNIKKAKEILSYIAENDKRILTYKGVKIAVSELGDNSVNLLLRVWTKNEDYWDVKFDLLEKTKAAFDVEGISFPFPQRDIHLYNEK